MEDYSKFELAQRLKALEDISLELIRPQSRYEILTRVVNKAVDLFECDAGSLYLEGDSSQLFFEVAVNRSIPTNIERRSMPVNDRGIASYVFRTGESLRIRDVYHLAVDAPYAFNEAVDLDLKYRTRSVMAHPLKNRRGEVVGVLQLINKKKDPKKKWPSEDVPVLESMPDFHINDAKLLESFAALASAAIENAKLQQDIENLFEGFVRASVGAIESRDFITRGHSDRVALLTVDLARKVSDDDSHDLRYIKFSTAQIAELRYAALLHDFGKIGVRESTLQKEEKLTAEQKTRMQARLKEFRASAEIEALWKYLQRLQGERRHPLELEMRQIKKQIEDFSLQLKSYWDLILELNRPTILNEDKSKSLDMLCSVHCTGLDHKHQPLIEASEREALKILKGSLNEAERLEIESHVTHSFTFLRQIPWTKELAGVPEIAYTHHEKLDGSGYPRKIKAADIPMQARIMAICDIYDALTAKDRPYKKSIPSQKALEILESDAKANKLDARFLKIFIEAKIYESPDFQKLSASLMKKAA